MIWGLRRKKPVDFLLTPEERARYVAQLRDFKERRLPDIARRRLEWTESDANALDALDDLNDESAFVGAAIETLEKMLPQARLISAEEGVQADYVRLGTRVRVRHEDGTERTYDIGLTLYDLPAAASGLQGATWDSAVAAALLGKRAGQTGVVKAPAGRYRLTVLSVEQPGNRR